MGSITKLIATPKMYIAVRRESEFSNDIKQYIDASTCPNQGARTTSAIYKKFFNDLKTALLLGGATSQIAPQNETYYDDAITSTHHYWSDGSSTTTFSDHDSAFAANNNTRNTPWTKIVSLAKDGFTESSLSQPAYIFVIYDVGLTLFKYDIDIMGNPISSEEYIPTSNPFRYAYASYPKPLNDFLVYTPGPNFKFLHAGKNSNVTFTGSSVYINSAYPNGFNVPTLAKYRQRYELCQQEYTGGPWHYYSIFIYKISDIQLLKYSATDRATLSIGLDTGYQANVPQLESFGGVSYDSSTEDNNYFTFELEWQWDTRDPRTYEQVSRSDTDTVKIYSSGLYEHVVDTASVSDPYTLYKRNNSLLKLQFGVRFIGEKHNLKYKFKTYFTNINPTLRNFYLSYAGSSVSSGSGSGIIDFYFYNKISPKFVRPTDYDQNQNLSSLELKFDLSADDNYDVRFNDNNDNYTSEYDEIFDNPEDYLPFVMNYRIEFETNGHEISNTIYNELITNLEIPSENIDYYQSDDIDEYSWEIIVQSSYARHLESYLKEKEIDYTCKYYDDLHVPNSYNFKFPLMLNDADAREIRKFTDFGGKRCLEYYIDEYIPACIDSSSKFTKITEGISPETGYTKRYSWYLNLGDLNAKVSEAAAANSDFLNYNDGIKIKGYTYTYSGITFYPNVDMPLTEKIEYTRTFRFVFHFFYYFSDLIPSLSRRAYTISEISNLDDTYNADGLDRKNLLMNLNNLISTPSKEHGSGGVADTYYGVVKYSAASSSGLQFNFDRDLYKDFSGLPEDTSTRIITDEALVFPTEISAMDYLSLKDATSFDNIPNLSNTGTSMALVPIIDSSLNI